MQYIEDRNYCKNCGRPSHCGITLHETIKNYNEPPTEIKICNNCRCGNCTETEEINNEF